jgi:hypothetical protein
VLAVDFRHTFITGLVRTRQDISVLKSLSGNARTDIVMRYSQPTEENKQQVIELRKGFENI